MSYEEEIMSKDKCLTIFLHQMEAICLYYPSNLFRNVNSFENGGIFLNISQLFFFRSCDVFRPIVCEQKYLMDYNRYYN